MAVLAVVVSVGFLLAAFGWRSWLQYRRTGSTGIHRISGGPSSSAWWAALLFYVAVAGWATMVALAVTGTLAPMTALDHRSVQIAGVIVATAGIAGTIWAQLAMGDAWRIGVDSGERTTLITGGPFRWVRNPIFTSIIAVCCGVALIVGNGVGVVAVTALVAATELQVRGVEEPYLRRVHSTEYLTYAARTGRFVPSVGKLQGENRNARASGSTSLEEA